MFAKSLNIDIMYTEVDSEGVYIPARNLIRIDSDLSESSTIAVFLHELGHVLDINLVDLSTSRIKSRIERAYTALDKKKATKTQIACIVKYETRAWDLARSLAKKLKIPLGKWFDQAQTCCTNSYKEYQNENS